MKINSAIYTVLLGGLLFPILICCKKEAVKVVPTVTITAVTNITATTASSGGEITSDGGDAVTVRGVCWSTNQNPTTADSKTSNGSAIGIFTSSLTGLTPGATYNIKAYGTNSVGSGYSSQSTFTTLAIAPVLTTTDLSAVTSTSASSGGNITNDGGSAITARGVCWSTSQNPTIADTKTSNGTGTGIFTSAITGLTPGATYYFRAYATNSIGTAYGNQLTTATTAVLPVLTTTAISALTSTTATSGGNITSDGGAAVTARGVCWSTSTTPTITNSKTTDATGTGIFVSSITGLTPGATYYIRAYATNSIGTAYGNQVTTTTTAVVPVLTTTTVSSIAPTTASSGGNISSDGGATVTVRGVCWSTSATPTITDSKTTDSSGTGSFASSLTGLTANTTYYVRAYATNSVGTSYGSAVSFTTSYNTFTDSRDGHVYKMVIIGTQTWMAENLAYLPSVSPNTVDSYTLPYYYVYDYIGTVVSAAKATANFTTYGVLYNTAAANSSAPTGWHIPTDTEWNVLVTYLGGITTAGTKLKSTTGWSGGGNGDNSSGFNALPNGGKVEGGSFSLLGSEANFWAYWTTTSYDNNYGWCWTIGNTATLSRRIMLRQAGWAVRCVKD
ncbi:MAG: hypothetical protein NTY07_07405 [Bacteroidia bacterium]|nr:hypothetical protein [Bacteroidia bacterium]